MTMNDNQAPFEYQYSGECQPQPCDADYFTAATTSDCHPSWNKFMTTKECQHYKQFLLCVRYQGKVRDLSCTVAEIHKLYSQKYSDMNISATLCNGSTFAGLEALMPIEKSDICSDTIVNRHLIYYYCWNDGYMTATDNKTKCLIEATMQLCVYNITHQTAGCDNIALTSQAFRDPDVRRDTLAANLNCETSYQCEMYMISELGPEIMERCLYSVANILKLPKLMEIPSFESAGPTFPCQVYTQASQCVLTLYGGQLQKEGFCNLTDIPATLGPVIKKLIESKLTSSGTKPQFDVSIYNNCFMDVSLDSDLCVDGADLLTLVTAGCGPAVMEHVVAAETDQACSTLGYCVDAIKSWYMDNGQCLNASPSMEQRLYAGQNNSEFASYFYNVTGLDWLTCPTDNQEECRDFIEMKIGKNVTDTCLQSAAGILFLPNLMKTTAYNDTSAYFRCRVWEQAFGCVMLMYGTLAASSGCDFNQLDKAVHPALISLVTAKVETFTFAPNISPFDAFQSCEIASLPPRTEMCLTAEDIVTTVTGVCGPHVYGLNVVNTDLSNVCGELYNCIEGIKSWWIEHNLCPDIISRKTDEVLQDISSINYFTSVTGFNSTLCLNDAN